MLLFKTAYKVKRENSDEIYKGLGFRHLSNATQYYVHPNNQSFKDTTTLRQSIGESISLFSLLLTSLTSGQGAVKGETYTADDASRIYIEVKPSMNWRSEGVLDSQIAIYRIVVTQDTVQFGAYRENDALLPGTMEHLHPLYKLLACFTGLLAWEMQTNDTIKQLLLHYIENPAADTFVNIHEDFYQNHKAEDFELLYQDVSGIDITDLVPFSKAYSIVRENKKAYEMLHQHVYIKFKGDTFSAEAKALIPQLASEFVLPPALAGICNAIAAGDVKAVLLHEPAGTGKTMACKLMCQAIGLPIFEIINCTENLDEFILGKFISEEEKIIFKESYITKAVREGGAVVFEEINFGRPQHLSFLNSLLDDNGFVRLDNGDVVRRHVNFRFFATMNLGYFGAKELNQSLYNRFNGIVEIAALSDESIRRMLLVRIPECEPVIEKLLSVYHKLKKKIETEELDVVISPRNLENWAKLAKYDGYLHAAEQTILPIAKCDRTLESTIRSILVLHQWN